MKETSQEKTLAGFLHQNREALVQETLRAFFEVAHGDLPPSLRERHLETMLRDKLAALEFDLLAGTSDHIQRHLRKSVQRAYHRGLSLPSRLRLNLALKHTVLDHLSRAFKGQPLELASMRQVLDRTIDKMLLELERAWRKRPVEEAQAEPILDAFFEAKRGLVSEQQFLNILIEQSPQAIVTLDKEHHVLTWNKAAGAITGLDSEEAVGRSFATMLDPQKSLASLIKLAKRQGQVQSHELKARRKEGEAVPIGLSLAVLPQRADFPARYLCLFGDLREHVRAREQAIAMEKLSALAGLSAAIAHEIRNPLNTLSLTIDVLEEILRDVEGLPEKEVSARLEVLREEINQMSEITRTYLAVGRLPAPQLEPRDLGEVLRNFTQQRGPELQKLGIAFEEDYPREMPPVLLDERQMRRAMQNLFRNACEAMPEGGRLRLSARLSDRAVEVELSDTGQGIPEAAMENLFVPFQTFKEGGTGLGLYLVREIMRAHGGSIAVRNRSEGGVRITLTMPISEEVFPSFSATGEKGREA